MLSAHQLERRRRGIGGSEVAAVLGIASPGGRTAIDVWACKARGRDGEIPPIVPEPPPDPDTCDAFAPFIKADVRTAGSVLEAGIVDLYQMITGAKVIGAGTRVHPEKPWAIATPDRYVAGDDGTGVERGLEIKLVSGHMAADWAHDELPVSVELQVRWGMAVADIDRWDVCALIGGTEPRIHRLSRDLDIEHELLEAVELFWETHIVGDVIPPASSPADAMKALRLQWAVDDGEVVEVEGKLARQVEELLTMHAEASAELKAAEQRKEAAQAALCALIGEHKGLEGDFGKAYWSSSRGRPSWKDIALELAGGVVPEELIERHRSEPARRFRAYPAKHIKAAVAAKETPET